MENKKNTNYEESNESEGLSNENPNTCCSPDETLEKLQQKTAEVQEYLDRLQRLAAEFDNYKKRTAKEKEMIYKDAVGDIISGLLPLLDNFERAISSCTGKDSNGVIEGIKMLEKQFKETIQKYGVSEIEALNNKFDPELHEAVIHVQDENYGDGIVIEELRKGYKYGDKVLRYSMVKVAN